jgi:hypothetical protein
MFLMESSLFVRAFAVVVAGTCFVGCAPTKTYPPVGADPDRGNEALGRAVETFSRIDAQLAALTAVEALRSYAAAHDGALPKRLEDVTDTPIPQNPATGKPFHYELQDGLAVISDEWSLSALRYTVRIRK